MKKIILLLLILGSVQITKAQSKDCTVQVTELRSSSGKCLVYLYQGKKGYPMEPKNSMASKSAVIQNGKATVTFANIPKGKYAISVVHDENGNGKMDTNFLGIPKEGIGTSKNIKSVIGPPSFEDSCFLMDNQNSSISINIKYL